MYQTVRELVTLHNEGGITMSSIVEKITLYDFFGYLIPGSLFTSLLCLRGMQGMENSISEGLSEYKSEFLLLFFLWAFLFGLLLSEVARIIADFIERKCLTDRYVSRIRTTANIDLGILGTVIQKSGLADNADIKKDAELEKYLPAIYGVVQSDEKYKRIHNYASSETMYKNLSAAVLFGGLIEIVYLLQRHQERWGWGIIIAWVLSTALLVHRYYRFRIKKYAYSLIWFTEKYQCISTTDKEQ